MTRVKDKTKKAKESAEIPVVDVYSLSGKKVDKFKLNPYIFNAPINKPLMHQVVVMHLANKRQGTVSTKTRAHVSGGGKKPWRQKGTGRARAGSIRSPLWRGGGVVFGPVPRDFSFTLPKKAKRLALKSSLSAKAKDNEIILLENDPELNQPKTKDIAKLLKALKSYGKRILFLYSEKNDKLLLSCRNIGGLNVKLCDDFSTYDVMANSRLLLSKGTHDCLVKKLLGREAKPAPKTK